MFFATAADDSQGLKALEVLQQAGYETVIVPIGEEVTNDAIAVFTPLENTWLRTKGFLRTSAIKLNDSVTPIWARNSPFRVGVVKTERPPTNRRVYYQDGFKASVKHMAERYQQWLMQDSTSLVPWSTSERDPTRDRFMTKVQSWLQQSEVQVFRVLSVIKRVNRNEIDSFRLGKWQVNYSRRPVVFPACAAEQAIALLGDWEQAFVREQTWVQKNKGLPSLLVRLDCIVQDGKLIVYEVEERPAGIGISSMINPAFGVEFQKLASAWEPFRIEVSPLRQGTDDSLWLPKMLWDQADAKLVLVRAEPEETEYHHLEPLSVSSLLSKGDKSYGEKMGLWQRVNSADQLDWKGSYVLKPLQGSKLQEMEIWDSLSRPGSSPRARVLATLAKNGTMFCQRLYPPMESGLPQFRWMIFRMFFGYDCGSQEWKGLGGNWNARSNLRIHGASDAVFGPAVIE